MRNNENAIRYVPVSVDGKIYCFDSRNVRSIALAEDCEMFPDELAGGIVGEAEFQGDEIPVIRLRSRLGTNETPQPVNETLVIIETEQGFCGFVVDDVHRTRSFREDAVYPLPKSADNAERPYFLGIVRLAENEGETEDQYKQLTQFGATYLPDAVSAQDYVFNDLDSEIDSADQNDVEDSQTAGLVLSHEGLLGAPPRSQSLFQRPPLDTTSLSNVTKRKGQVMLFSMPHKQLDEKPVAIGFSVSEVMEVAHLEELLSVPGTGEDFYGLLPWRNQFVPVIDLTSKFELGPIPEEARRRIVIIRSSDDQLFGFYATDEIRTVRLPFPAESHELPGISKLPITSGSFVSNEGDLLLFPKSTVVGSETVPQTAA